MSEDRYVRARWRLINFSVCVQHGVVLKSGMVEPAFSGNYKHPSVRAVHEITEEEMLDGATCPTGRGLTYSREIWGAVEAAISNLSPPYVVAEAIGWALLADRLVEAATKALRGAEYPSDSVPLHEHRAWWLAQHGMSIGASRLQVSGFLRALPGSAHRRAVMGCLSRLISDEERVRTVMSRLPLADLKAELLAATAVAEGERGCGGLPRVQRPERHTSFEATQAALGCTALFLTRMIDDGLFQDVKSMKFGRKTYVFVPDEEVRKAQRFLASCWTYEEMLAALQIDRRAYWLLRDCRLIDPIAIGSWRRYRKEDVGALIARLNDVALPVPARHGHLQPLLGEWIHMPGRVRNVVRQVLDELLAGRIRLYRDLGAGGLEAYLVDEAAPAQLRRLSEVNKARSARLRSTSTQIEMWAAA
jgi:hypothetical protein